MRRGASRPVETFSLPPDRDIMDGLSRSPIRTLSKPEEDQGKAIVIKNFQYVGSYNWTDSTKPTIIIPGSPPEWRDRSLPYVVPPDSGIRFVDQNGYRMPSSTLHPLLRAVDITAEDAGDEFDWSTVDFVTDRNGLRKILRWINDHDGSAKEFRIETQLAGKRTVLFSRWEKRTREAPNSTFTTYGFSFERESTTKAPGCEKGTGHHRIVKYSFDGLVLVVRFEVDACIAPSRSSRATAAGPTDVDSLSDMLSGLNVASDKKGAAKVDESVSTPELDVIRAGTRVPQSSVIEMCTRSRRNAEQFDWVDAFPQLYFSQTPNHYLAVHSRGEFETITKKHLDNPEMKSIEASAQSGFRKLKRTLQDIQELVIEHGQRGRLSLVHRDGQLRVFERTSQTDSIPEQLLSRFD
ncbi:hypothetical protein WOLCODRAFT_98991 [Wolfiporia cocos MD-104 SS10]|uniref:Geranylgeranyl pyrophosphate synthetase n=1 Tax=Wolfiporia cocos (strain MD-104) TaxID=742152 RepID=A0A2H3JKV7_WOLCO|nr:hypothetical protein WOLCODRAFT_98991 [Wolfiporia cocos MD-104 SS10]